MSTPTLTIYRGLPGSGKSTGARNHIQDRMLQSVDRGIVRIERDQIRRELNPIGNHWYEQEFEGDVTKAQDKRITLNLTAGNDVLASDTNLPNRSAGRLARVGVLAGASVKFAEYRFVPLEACLENNAKRKGTDKFVDPKFITGAHERFIKGKVLTQPAVPSLEELQTPQLTAEKYVPSQYGIPTVLLDLDGTAALHNGRNPYDTTLYHTDGISGNVLDITLGLHHLGYRIDIMTGRDAKFRSVCEKWARNAGFPYTEMHMRPEGNTERDDKVKLDLFEKFYRKNDLQAVQFCIDDRDRVVSMYRNVLGLQVMQVAEGNF